MKISKSSEDWKATWTDGQGLVLSQLFYSFKRPKKNTAVISTPLSRTASTLTPHLQSLNGALSSTHLIREDGLTAADVVVWVTLYRILGDKTHWDESSAAWDNLDHLKKWYLRLESHPAFKVCRQKK